MKRLFLLRHAKAAQTSGKTSDFDRPLALPGVQEGETMALYIARRGYGIDLVLSSTAARAVQTAELVLRPMRGKETATKIEYRDNLYLAEAPRLVAAIRGAPASVSGLMIVGHNPGPGTCAAHLAGEPMPGLHMSPATLVVLDFAVGRWRDVREGTGALVDCMRPADL
jgi:phosphohistidine phosphatase